MIEEAPSCSGLEHTEQRPEAPSNSGSFRSGECPDVIFPDGIPDDLPEGWGIKEFADEWGVKQQAWYRVSDEEGSTPTEPPLEATDLELQNMGPFLPRGPPGRWKLTWRRAQQLQS